MVIDPADHIHCGDIHRRALSSYWGIHYFGSGFVSPSLRNNIEDINLILSD